MKDQNISDAFRELFLPNGQVPLSGFFSRRLDLASILDAVAVKGISEFYSGNLTQEMVAAVRKTFFSPVSNYDYISSHEFRTVSFEESLTPQTLSPCCTLTSAFYILARVW